MKPRTRGILVMLAPGAVLGLAVLLIGVLAWLGLGAEQQAVLVQASGSLIPMSIMGWLIASAALAMPAQRLFQDHVQALAQLEEQTRILVSGQSRQAIEGSGQPCSEAMIGLAARTPVSYMSTCG